MLEAIIGDSVLGRYIELTFSIIKCIGLCVKDDA